MNSQLIEVGIGLVLAFLVVSLAASSFVEMPSTRAAREAGGGTIIDLEMVEKGRSMLGPPTAADSLAAEAAADDETPPAP